jgi:hypothetical protein
MNDSVGCDSNRPVAQPITLHQAITLVARALSLYLLVWLLSDLSYFPADLHSLFYYTREAAITGGTYMTHTRDHDIVLISLRLLRMVALFFAVQWCYRVGPSLQRYFLSSTDDESA